MPRKPQYEVVDSYGVVCFTGTLEDCGTWIDPVLGIDFEATAWGPDKKGRSIDHNRFELRSDGSYLVRMYDFGGMGGSGGELIVRPCQ